MIFFKGRTGGIGIKLLFIAGIIILLLIGLASISSQLKRRQWTSSQAQEDIFKSAGNAFSLDGPYISIPIIHTWYTEFTNYEGKKTTEKHEEILSININASKADMKANLNSEVRSIGIYSAPVYTGSLNINAQFDIKLEEKEGYEYQLDKALVYVSSPKKNLTGHPNLFVNEKSYMTDLLDTIRSNNDTNKNDSIGTMVAVRPGLNDIDITVSFRGARLFTVLPSAKSSTLTIDADWPAPNFTGFDYLPTNRSVTSDGFTATWNIPFNSTSQIGFRYVQSVDLYKQLERAFTYGFLFIIVPFLVLFLFELFAHIQLHPMHYLLCGAACVIFFLLLLSLSEHLSFLTAYLIGAFAATLLVSFYIASVTGKTKLGIAMAGLFAILYAYLYFSLKSEDYAFLIGSIFIFLILAAVMFLTRKVDWNIISTTLSIRKNDDRQE